LNHEFADRLTKLAVCRTRNGFASLRELCLTTSSDENPISGFILTESRPAG